MKAGDRVKVDFIGESATIYSGKRFTGYGVLDRVEDGRVFGRLDDGTPFMCLCADVEVVCEGMNRIPCEADLMSADDNTYGNALVRCQNAAQDCPEAGYCKYGECFNQLSYVESVERLEVIEKELKHYKSKWSKLNSQHLHLISCLKLAVSDAVKNNNSEYAFAYRSCLTMLERVI